MHLVLLCMGSLIAFLYNNIHIQETVPHPHTRSAKVGEVGWGVVKLMDYTLLKSGHQIMVHISLAS